MKINFFAYINNKIFTPLFYGPLLLKSAQMVKLSHLLKNETGLISLHRCFVYILYLSTSSFIRDIDPCMCTYLDYNADFPGGET